jgi:hypothetical protein
VRHSHCTITPSVVRSLARQALSAAVPLKGYGRLVSPARLLDLLLLAACLRLSLSAAARRLRFGFSHETARKAVAANLPPLAELAEGLVGALHLFGGRALRRRRWVVAIDEHRCPYYGDRSAEGVTGGQKKAGTKYAYAYATACLVHRRHRYTVGLLPLDGSLRPHQVVEALLGQLAARGLRLRGVVLDSGFDSGDTLLLLQRRGLSYAVPLRRKGGRAAGGGENRRNAAWLLEEGSVTTVSWRTDKGREPVSTRALVHRRRGEREKKVYAFGGWGEREARPELRRAALARRWYRRRFGIETSYRQMNEAKARTTRKDAAYRLLLLGVALLLRQAWVWLAARLAKARGLRPSEWAGELPLARMLSWLADLLKRRYKEERGIELGSPLPPLSAA